VHDVVAQRRYADTWTWPDGFHHGRKKEISKKKTNERKKEKERHLIRAAAPALSFKERWSSRRICIA